MFFKTDGLTIFEAFSSTERTNVMFACLRREVLCEEKLLKRIPVLERALEIIDDYNNL